MRGFLLSLDAIAASAILLVLGLFIAAFSFQLGSEELQTKQVYYTGKDLTNILFTATVEDLREFPIIKEHFNNGTLTNNDMNRTMLELIGYWWSIGNISQAQTMTTQIIDRLLNGTVYGYEITIDNDIIFSRPKLGAKQISQSSYVISGFELGQQPEGVVASAYATIVDTNNSFSIDIGPEGSGVESGQMVLIKKQFYFNSSQLHLTTIPSLAPKARIWLSLQHGPNSINVNAVKLNGNPVQMQWIYDYNKGLGKLSFGSGNITPSLLIDQWNELEMTFDGHTQGDSRTRPGSRLEFEYRGNITDFFPSTIEDQIIYLDDIYSNGSAGKNSGSWTIIPFFIPEGATVTNATLFIHGKEINNVSNIPNIGPGVARANVMVFLNNKQIDAFNPGKPVVPPNTEYEAYRYLNLLNATIVNPPGPVLPGGATTTNVSSGTNVLSIYLNCYNTTFWGMFNTQLYSRPSNDSKNSSFLRITYTKPSNEQKFGYLAIAAEKFFYGQPSNPNNLTLTLNATRLLRTFLHIAQLDSSNITITVNTTSQNKSVFVTPRPFATPSTVYIPESAFNTSGTSSIYLRDKCTDQCYFLPVTSLEYYPWIPSLVGYGEVFPNDTAALDDAIARLRGSMGDYANATNVQTVIENVPRIQTLWGPARMDVRVWL